MPQSVLFDEPTSPRLGPLGWVEPSVHWYTESTRPEAVASRRTVNAWYEAFPDTDGSFGERLRSEVDVDHHQALDELYVHSQLSVDFDDVRYEEGGVGPDFRVYLDGKCIGAIEVVSLFQPQDWTDEELRHLRLADDVSRRLAPTHGYFVDFEIEWYGGPVSPRRFTQHLAGQLESLPDPDMLSAAQRDQLTIPTTSYTENGTHIEIRFSRMRPRAPARSDPEARIVDTGPAIGGLVETAARLRDRLGSKAGSRYDLGDRPYLVLVGIHDTVCSDDQVLEGLYGRETVTVPTGVLGRANDGFFGVDRTRPDGRNRRVSAVAVLRGLQPWALDRVDLASFHNPNASRPWPTGLLRFGRTFGPVAETESSVRFDWVRASVTD